MDATTVTIVYATLTLIVSGLWVMGYLDAYQKMAQNALLGAAGDNRMSYGLKSAILPCCTRGLKPLLMTLGTIKSQEVTDDKDFQQLQGDVADTAGGLVGKGGIGEGIGSTISKGL